MIRCFVPGCTGITVGRCEEMGPGCGEHLGRWARSAARLICGEPLDPESPGRRLAAKVMFLQTLTDEMKIDAERRRVAVKSK